MYPGKDPEDQLDIPQQSKPSKGKLRFLPGTLRRIIHLFLPRRKLTEVLIKEIKAHGCDAIVIRTGSVDPIIGRIKKACPDARVCLEINSAAFDESFPGLPLRSLFQKLEVLKFSAADAIVVVSTYLKHYLEQRGIPSGKILVNHNGVSMGAVEYSGNEDIRQRCGIPKEAFLLGYIGGMEPFRRLPEVVLHIAELRRAGNNDIYTLLIGDGKDMPAVQAAIKANADVLGDSVNCLGWKAHTEVAKYLAALDVAIFPFTNDYCSPLKLFEYLGAGVPTIGPDTSAVREVFEDGVHLELVQQDGSDFMESVLKLKNNPQLRSELGKNGRQLVLAEYTWEKNAERVIRHIQSVRT